METPSPKECTQTHRMCYSKPLGEGRGEEHLHQEARGGEGRVEPVE